jgi:hypothetical protein
MKLTKIFAIMAFCFMITTAMAEEEKKDAPPKKDNPPKTLFNSKDANFSGYGGIYTKYSKIGEANSCLVGGRGGLIVNDSFVLGLAGIGLVHPTDRGELTDSEYTGTMDTVDFGYGGFLFEYYFNPKDLIVFSAGSLIGGGGLSFHENEDSGNDEGSDKFFVIEPELNVFVNVTRFCRIGIGVSYRFVSGINTDEFSDKDFRGAGATVMAQFGWF